MTEKKAARNFLTFLALAAAVFAACAVLWPVAFAKRVPAFGDNVSFWAPNTSFWMSQVRAGHFPLWNPYIAGGVPFAGDINHGIFYPPNWLVFVFGAARGTGLLVVAHLALGIFGMYVFLTTQTVRPFVAIWGGIVFGLSQAFLMLVNHVVMLESMSYMGIVLYLAWRLASGGGVKAALGLAAATALSAAAGDVHATYIIAVAAAAVFVTRCAGRFVAGERAESVQACVLAAGAAIGAALLAAVALLPAIEFAFSTERTSGGASYAVHNGLDLKAVMGVMFPDFWGSLAGGTVWNARWGDAAYLGIIVLGLAAFGAGSIRRAACGIALFVVGLGLSFGEYSPLWNAARKVLPGFEAFKQPREYFIVLVVGAMILAARALSGIIDEQSNARKAGGAFWSVALSVGLIVLAASAGVAFFHEGALRLVGGRLAERYPQGTDVISVTILRSVIRAGIVLGGGLAAFSLLKKGLLRARTVAVILALAVVTDYAVSAAGASVYGQPALYQGRRPTADVITSCVPQGTDVRYVAQAQGFGEYFEAFAGRRVKDIWPGERKSFDVLMRVKDRLVDDEGLYAGLPTVLGYSTFLPKRYAALYEAATGLKPGPVRLKAVEGADYGLLEATVLVEFPGDGESPRASLVGTGQTARMVYNWVPVDTFERARAILEADRDKAALTPVVEGLPAATRRPGTAEPLHSIEGLRRVTDRMWLRVVTDEPGLLFVAEGNFPGWKAYDNGAETPIYYANLTFRAIYLNAGRHEIEFRFEPRSFYWGGGISIAACMAAAIAGISIARKPRKR